MIQRNARKSTYATFVIWIGVSFVILSGILIIILSGSDRYRQCKAPLDVAPYRGIGIGANITFARLLNKGNDSDFPLQISPDPVILSNLMDQTSGTPQSASIVFPKLSNIMWGWLQFISNDLIYTKPSTENDTIYAGTGMPPLTRTFYRMDEIGNRQQVNFATPYLDGSNVYGTDLNVSFLLRRLDGTGKMKTSPSPFQDINDSEMLPYPYGPYNQSFLGTDDRVTQHPLLTAFHVLMVREHNYWCDKLKVDMPYLTENELYNTARHLVVAEIQSITYREALPLLLGIDNLDPTTCFTHIEFNTAYSLNKKRRDKFYRHHTSILNEFATAATRALHSLVTETLILRDPQSGDVTSEINLKDWYNNGSLIWQQGIDDVLLGASLQLSEKRDVRLVDAIRLHLFQNTDPSSVINLAARDVARGRDHMLPSYQDFYRHFKKFHPSIPITCEEFSYSSDICQELYDIYGSATAHIDLFVGLLIEKRYNRSVLGIVGTRLFEYQFSHIKHNDHYFYLWDRVIDNYGVEIHNTRLSKIIRRNTNIDSSVMDPNVFLI
jgi:peroxidase